MTATVPPQVRLDARNGYVYGYPLRDPVTGMVRIDYVGQTRDLARRDLQHRGLAPQRDGTVWEQPWSDLIDGGPVVLQYGLFTDAELDAAELGHMHRLLPRFNYAGSITPDAIPKWAAIEQRQARDVARGVPSGVYAPPPRAVDPTRVPPRRSLWARVWATRAGRATSAWLRGAATVAGFWTALTTVGTVALWLGCSIDPQTAGGLTAVGVTAGMAKWWPRRKPRRRRR